MLLVLVFGNDHFRLMADDRYRINRRLLNRRIDVGIALFCDPQPDEAVNLLTFAIFGMSQIKDLACSKIRKVEKAHKLDGVENA